MSVRRVQLRRGTTAENNAFTGAVGEITVNTSNNSIRVHDGATLGGEETAKADLSNILPSTNVDFNAQKIVNVANPVDNQDVATKLYVDTHGGGGGSLATLSDVDVAGVAPGEYLKYSGTEWINDSLSTADLSDGVDIAMLVGGTLTANLDGNALTSSTWLNAMTLNLTGTVLTGSVAFDGSTTANLNASLNDASIENSKLVNSSIAISTYDLALGGTLHLSNDFAISAGGTLSFAGGGGAPTSLDDLVDTNIGAYASGQVLVYNTDNSKWENKVITGDASLTASGTLTLGAISNDKLVNSSIGIGTYDLALGGTLALSNDFQVSLGGTLSLVGGSNVGNFTFTNGDIENPTDNYISVIASNYAQLESNTSYIWVEQDFAHVEVNTNVWDFTANGTLILPANGDIFDSNGNSVLVKSINDLNDVSVGGLGASQVLIYNNDTSNWENKTLSGDATITTSGTLTLSAISNAKLVNSSINIGGQDISLGGTVNLDGGLSIIGSTLSVGNVATASALFTAVTLSIGGSVITGSVSFDGSSSVEILADVTPLSITDGMIANATISNAKLVHDFIAFNNHEVHLSEGVTINGTDGEISVVANQGVYTIGLAGTIVASSAIALAKTINLAGDLTGSVSLDNAFAAVTLTATLGTITNAQLQHSFIAVNDFQVSLGNNLDVVGANGVSITMDEPNSLMTIGLGTLTNANLEFSSINIGGTDFALGSTLNLSDLAITGSTLGLSIGNSVITNDNLVNPSINIGGYDLALGGTLNLSTEFNITGVTLSLGTISIDNLSNNSITFADSDSNETIALGGTLTFLGVDNETSIFLLNGEVNVGLANDVEVQGNLTVNSSASVLGDLYASSIIESSLGAGISLQDNTAIKANLDVYNPTGALIHGTTVYLYVKYGANSLANGEYFHVFKTNDNGRIRQVIPLTLLQDGGQNKLAVKPSGIYEYEAIAGDYTNDDHVPNASFVIDTEGGTYTYQIRCYTSNDDGTEFEVAFSLNDANPAPTYSILFTSNDGSAYDREYSISYDSALNMAVNFGAISTFNQTEKSLTFNSSTGNLIVEGSVSSYGLDTKNSSGATIFEVTNEVITSSDFSIAGGTLTFAVKDGANVEVFTIDSNTGDTSINGDLTVTGSLIVNGTVTAINTVNLDVEDSLIELAHGTVGAPINDSGFVIARGDEPSATLFWNENTDTFIFATSTSINSLSTGNLLNLGGTLTYGQVRMGAISLVDNQATSLDIKEGSNSYLKFVTTDSSEKVVFGKKFEAPTESKIADLEFQTGYIYVSSGNLAINTNGGNVSIDDNVAISGTFKLGHNTQEGESNNVGVRFDYYDSPLINAEDIVNGTQYIIQTVGNSDFTLVGALFNQQNWIFTANANGTPLLVGTTGKVYPYAELKTGFFGHDKSDHAFTMYNTYTNEATLGDAKFNNLTLTGELIGNAQTASALLSAVTLSIGGSIITGSVSFDGSTSVEILADITPNSITGGMIANTTIANANLVNDSVYIGSHTLSLGGTLNLSNDFTITAGGTLSLAGSLGGETRYTCTDPVFVTDATTLTAPISTVNKDAYFLNNSGTPGTVNLFELTSNDYNGYVLAIFNTDTATMTIDGFGTQTIGGALTKDILSGGCLTIMAKGTSWYIM